MGGNQTGISNISYYEGLANQSAANRAGALVNAGMNAIGARTGGMSNEMSTVNKILNAAGRAVNATNAVESLMPQSWGGNPYYSYGGGGGYSTPDYDDLWNKSVAANKADNYALNKQFNQSDNRIKQANQSIQRIAREQRLVAGLNANNDFQNRTIKQQAAESAMANANIQTPWSSANTDGLNYLIATLRDLDSNEIRKDKRNAISDVNVNEYNALESNRLAAMKNASEYLANLRQDRSRMATEVAGQYEKAGEFFKNGKLNVKDDSALGYLNDYIKKAIDVYSGWNKSKNVLQRSGLTMPDGKNRADSSPFAAGGLNTNTFNNAGTVSTASNRNNKSRVATAMNNFNNAISTGYPGRNNGYSDENPNRTRAETGR